MRKSVTQARLPSIVGKPKRSISVNKFLPQPKQNLNQTYNTITIKKDIPPNLNLTLNPPKSRIRKIRTR